VRVAPPVELSPEERARLQRLRQRTGPRRVRAEIVLLASDGLQDLEIGRRVGVGRQTAARWRRKFLASRLGGLERRAGALRPGRIPEQKLRAIVRATLARSAPEGRIWSTRRLARELGVSHMTVQRVWESYGFRPVRFEAHPLRADPIASRAPWDVIGLYLTTSVAALVVTLHPNVVVGAGADGSFRRTDWAARRTPFAGGEGFGNAAPLTRSLSAATDPKAEAPSRIEGFLGFLGDLGTRNDRGPSVRVVATGRVLSETPALDRWRVRHPRFEFEVASDFASWRARATRELLAAGRGPTPRGQFRGRAELTRALVRSVGAYSGQGGAFVWTARRREIAEGEAAYRLRYDLAVTGHRGFKPPGPIVRTMAPSKSRDGLERASARSVLRQHLHVRPGDRVTIESWTATLDYANAFVLETLRLGARPLLLYQDEPTYWAATTEVPARSLAQIGEHRRAALEHTDVFVSFFGPSDRERFHALPTPTLFRLGEYQDALYQAAAKAGARAVEMAIGRVSAASARMYNVDEAAWRQELLEATLVAPRVLHRRGRTVAEKLEQGRELEIRHSNGTRLALRLRGRKAHVSDGTVAGAHAKGSWNLVTLPAGVVSVAVDESFAEGSFRSNVAISTGLSDSVGEFKGGRWTFENGRLARFAYDEGLDLFTQSYDRAGEGRDRPGYISIGLNERTADAPLLEDQGLGTVGLVIGRNSLLGGKTRTPWWAWMLLRGSTVTVDGEALVRNGAL